MIRDRETNFGFCSTAAVNNPLDKFDTSCGAAAAVLAQERIDPTRASVLIGQGVANSSYHAGQFTLEKRLSRIGLTGLDMGNFQFNANYTYSSFMSEADDILGAQANRPIASDPRDPSIDKAPSGFDQPHRFVVNFVWGLPGLADTSGGVLKSFVSRVVNGWQLSAIGTYASGTPYSVLNANNALGITPGQVNTVDCLKEFRLIRTEHSERFPFPDGRNRRLHHDSSGFRLNKSECLLYRQRCQLRYFGYPGSQYPENRRETKLEWRVG